MLEPLAIASSDPHRTVQGKAIAVRAQRPLHKWLIACATTDANITLASVFA
ncbi:MAG: hypothetical protein ACI8UD_002580 [Planctomycetota bacterium]|jgi:hypothetical protein